MVKEMSITDTSLKMKNDDRSKRSFITCVSNFLNVASCWA